MLKQINKREAHNMSNQIKQVGEIPALNSYLSTPLKEELRANIRLVICFLANNSNHYEKKLSWHKYQLLFVPIYLSTHNARRYFLSDKPSANMVRQFIDDHLKYQYGMEGPISAQLKKAKRFSRKYVHLHMLPSLCK